MFQRLAKDPPIRFFVRYDRNTFNRIAWHLNKYNNKSTYERNNCGSSRISLAPARATADPNEKTMHIVTDVLRIDDRRVNAIANLLVK